MQIPSIRVSNVSRRYGTMTVLQPVSLDIFSGQILGLLGPSGAGKTTLVRQIAGSDVPTSGEVFILGEKMPQLSLLPRIGYMAQSDALYNELTGRHNMEFFGAMYELRGNSLSESLNKAASIVGLVSDLDRPVQQYSGGMKRRLSLAISLMHKPSVLLLDEPTVGIDPLLRKSIWDELRQLARAGATVLVTTHVMDEAEKCDSVAMMRDGRLIALDTPAALKVQTGAASLEDAFLTFALSPLSTRSAP